MNQVTSCHHAGCLMDAKDHEAEKIAQDGMCIECREHVEKCKEEEAEWFSKIIAAAGFRYDRRVPSDINRKATYLSYLSNGLSLNLFWANSFITLCKSPRELWGVQFSFPTPVPLILATIKAAVENEK